MYLKICNVYGFRGLDKNSKYLKFEQYRIRFFGVTEAHAIYGRKIRTQNTEDKSGSQLTYVDFWVTFQNIA